MMIYDLDNEYGARIIGDGEEETAALEINSLAKPAIAIYSTASAAPLDVMSLTAGNSFGARFRSAVTTSRAVVIGRTVASSTTVAPLLFTNPSAASAAIFEVAAGFISCTSVVLTTVANFDYVVPISLNGNIRYIPTLAAAGIVGGAKFV